MIVDEEHRFGVAHKERLKQLRKLVDVLTLTATPIPRTLQMAFSGMRDLSVMQTPPPDRIAVRTQVARVSEDLIREAVDRELRRGGQVFFVHNRIETIGEIADYVRRMVPSARHRRRARADVGRTRSRRPCSRSCGATSTCWCAPRSSSRASTSPTPTRS